MAESNLKTYLPRSPPVIKQSLYILFHPRQLLFARMLLLAPFYPILSHAEALTDMSDFILRIR